MQAGQNSGRRAARRTGAVIAATAMAGGAAPAAAGVVDDGRNLEVAPAIDFVLAEGWPEGSTVRVEVLRGTTLIAQKTGQVDGADTDTTFEVNHVGGDDCWEGTGGTPDVKPGDEIRVTTLTGPAAGNVNFTYARDISFTEDAGGVLHGRALGAEDADGLDLAAPVDLEGATVEARRIGAQRFSAPVDVDPATGAFSTQLGGTPGSGEVSIDYFTGGDAAAGGGGQETTSGFPVGETGEQPCGPLQTTGLTQVSHPAITAANVGTDLVLGGPEAGVADTISSVSFAGRAYPVQRDGDAGTWRAVVPAADLASLAQGSHQLTVTHSPSGSETRTIVKDTVAPVITADPPAGTYAEGQGVALLADGGEEVRFTRDGQPASSTSAAYAGTPIVLGAGTHRLRARAVDAVGNAGVADLTYVIRAAAPPPGVSGPRPTEPPAMAGPGPAPTPVAGSGTGLPDASAPARLGVGSVGLRSRLPRAVARRIGLALSLQLPPGARVVEVTVLRLSGTRARRVASVRQTVAGGGRHRLRLRSAALRRALRPGRYAVDVATGRSAGEVGTALRRTVTITGSES